MNLSWTVTWPEEINNHLGKGGREEKGKKRKERKKRGRKEKAEQGEGG